MGLFSRRQNRQNNMQGEGNPFRDPIEIWVKFTPDQNTEVWLARVEADGSLASKFVLKSVPEDDNPIDFAVSLARWMHVAAKTIVEVGGSWVGQVRYDPNR
jgi:hypothetical protein